MNQQERAEHEAKLEKKWTKQIDTALKGKTIAGVRYLTHKECEQSMWGRRPVMIIFTDGTYIIPMMDDEGNDGGSLETNIKGLSVIPVM